MNQLDLLAYEAPRARRSDPETSRESAAAIGAAVSEIEGVVLAALREHGPMTSHEVAAITGLSLVTASPRFAPLQRKNLVIDSGERRAGATFKRSIVWKAVP